MEIMEWLDLKYEAYLCQVNLIKHEQVNIGKSSSDTEEVKALKLMASDHEMMMNSLDKKINELLRIEEILRRIEQRTGSQRKKIEMDVEEIQNDLQRLKYDKVISEIKATM